MSFLRWCEHCRTEGIKSPVCRYRVTSTAVVEMCSRLECFDLVPQLKQCSGQKDSPSCGKLATSLEEQCQCPGPSASSVSVAPTTSCRRRKTRNTRAIEGAPSSSNREPPVYVCDSTSAMLLSAAPGQETIRDRKKRKKSGAVKGTPSSPPKKPPHYVSDSISSESSGVICGQETIQDKNRTETRHVAEHNPSSRSRQRSVCLSNSTSAAFLSAVSGKDKTKKEACCAFDVDHLGKAPTAERAARSVLGRPWTAAVVLAVPGEAAAEESDFVSAKPKDAAEDNSGESNFYEEAAASPASDGSLENRVKFCMLPNKASESALDDRNSEHSDSKYLVDGTTMKFGEGEAESPMVAHVTAAALALSSSASIVAPHVARDETTENTHAHESLSMAAASITLPAAPCTAPQKQNVSSPTFQDYSPAALKPLSYVSGLSDKSEVGLSGSVTGAGVATAAEPPRCCQQVDNAIQSFTNNNVSVVKPTTGITRSPENCKLGLRNNLAVAGRTLSISPSSLPQEKAVHHTVSDHCHTVGERMSDPQRNEGNVLESFTAVSGTSLPSELCPRGMQAVPGTLGSHATVVEEPAPDLPHEDQVGLCQSSVVNSKASTIRPLTLVQEEVGHQAAVTECAPSLCVLPDGSDRGAPVSSMETVGISSPEFLTCPHEQQDNFKAVESHSPISDFSGMPNSDEVGPRESADVAGKLSPVILPTLPQQDGAVHQTVLDDSRAVVEHTNHTYCLPQRSEDGEPEFLETVSDTMALGSPMCLQEKKVGFENLGLFAVVEAPTSDLCSLPDGGDRASLRQSPAVASETLPVDLATPLQKEQETSEYSTNSNSSPTKPCSDASVGCRLSSSEVAAAPSADHMYAVVSFANIPACVPDANELDLKGNSAVPSELSFVGSPKSLPERLEDGQKKASYVSAPLPDYISEESLPIGAEVSLQENTETNSTTPSLGTPKAVQEEQRGTENTHGHPGALSVPCHTNQLPSLSSTSVVGVLGLAEDPLSATLRIAESMSKLESSQRKAGYHDSAPTAGYTEETSLSVRGEDVNSRTTSAQIPGTVQIEMGGTYTNQEFSSSSTSEVDLLVSDDDSMSATLHIAETMSKLPSMVASTVYSFQQIIPPSSAAVTVEKTADVRGTVGMPTQTWKGGDSSITELMAIPSSHPSNSGETIWGGGSGHVVPAAVAVTLAGVPSGSAGQAGLLSSSAVCGPAVVLTTARIASTGKVKRIMVALPSRSNVAGQCSQAVQSANTKAGGLKRPNLSASSENEGLSGDAQSRLDSRVNLAVIKKLCSDDRSTPVGRTSMKAGRCAPKSSKKVAPAGKGRQAATRTRQSVVPRTGRKQASGAQRKGKLPSQRREHIVPDVLHPVPSPLSSELSSASSKPSHDGSSGPSDNRSGLYLPAKLRSTKCPVGQPSSTAASEKTKFMEAIQNRILQASTSTGRLPGYHSALASRQLYRSEAPVTTSKCQRTVEKSTSDVEVDLDHYITELSTTKDLEQYDSVLSDLFDSYT